MQSVCMFAHMGGIERVNRGTEEWMDVWTGE